MVGPVVFQSVPIFGSGASKVQPPSPSPYVNGYLAGDVLPAEHLNWILNGLTGNESLGWTALNHVIAELDQVVTDAGLSLNGADDTQVSDAITLRSRHGWYVLAHSGSTQRWKDGADYVMTGTEDMGAKLTALHAAGEKLIFIAPGDYSYSTPFIPINANFFIRGAGKDTHITTTGATTFFEPPPYAQVQFRFQDLFIESTYTTAVGGLYIFNGVTNAGLNEDQCFSRVKVKVAADMIGFYRCQNLDGCIVENVGTIGGQYFFSCQTLTRCQCISSTAIASGAAQGFASCQRLSSCFVNFTGGGSGASSAAAFSGCIEMTGCNGAAGSAGSGGAIGFQSCQRVAGCQGTGDTAGFKTCTNVTGCAGFGTTYGFDDCDNVSCCLGQAGTGFNNCRHVVGNLANSSCTTGFSACKQAQQNRSIAITTKYSTTFADQSTNAAANTAAGGYNSSV